MPEGSSTAPDGVITQSHSTIRSNFCFVSRLDAEVCMYVCAYVFTKEKKKNWENFVVIWGNKNTEIQVCILFSAFPHKYNTSLHFSLLSRGKCMRVHLATCMCVCTSCCKHLHPDWHTIHENELDM